MLVLAACGDTDSDSEPVFDSPIGTLELTEINPDDAEDLVFSIHREPTVAMTVTAVGQRCFSDCADDLYSVCEIIGIRDDQIWVRAGFKQRERRSLGLGSCNGACRRLAADCGTVAIDRADFENPLVIIDENGYRFEIEPDVELPARIEVQR
jgi:hypothetical protein